MTQFTRKDVERVLLKIKHIDEADAQLLRALLSDMDVVREALNNIHKTTEDQEASELAFYALSQCAKWRVV